MSPQTSRLPGRAHSARKPHKITRFALLLREYRERSGMTQDQLATLTKMSLSAIGKLERGERYAPYDYSLSKIIRALGLSPDERDGLIEAANKSRPSASQLAADERDELEQRDELDEASDLEEVGGFDTVSYGEAPTEPGAPFAEGHIPTGSAADTTPLAGAGDARTLTVELWGWRLDVLAALTISVRWLRSGAIRMPGLRGKQVIALVGVALLLVSLVAYVFARVTPASAVTWPFASADAQGWLVAERDASGLPSLLAIMNARTGAWRPLWPDTHALSATQSPSGADAISQSLTRPHSPAYAPSLHLLAFIVNTNGDGGAIWVARITLGGDGWPAIQPSGPSLAVTDCGGCGALAWSPDGAWLLYDARAGIRALSPATGATRVLTTNVGDSWPACSPDGHWLAYQRGENKNGSIVATAASDCLPVTGAGARTLYLNGYFPSWSPAWSPDSSLLAFTTYANGLKHGVRAVSLKDLSSAPSYLSRTPTVAVSQAGCENPTWARQPSGGEMVVFTCDNPTQTERHGTVVIAPGALSPTPSWQAVEDTGVNAFDGVCWMPS